MMDGQSGFGTLPKDRLLAEFSLWSADLRIADDVARVDGQFDIYHPMCLTVTSRPPCCCSPT